MSSAGARTHENETSPEEIYDDQSLSVRKMFSHLDMTLVGIKIESRTLVKKATKNLL